MVRKDMEPSSAVVSSGDLQPVSNVAAEYFLCGVTAADFLLAGVAETDLCRTGVQSAEW